MIITITKKANGKFRYIANWNTSGIPFYTWFYTLKDLHEYFESWENVTFIKSNF